MVENARKHNSKCSYSIPQKHEVPDLKNIPQNVNCRIFHQELLSKMYGTFLYILHIIREWGSLHAGDWQ